MKVNTVMIRGKFALAAACAAALVADGWLAPASAEIIVSPLRQVISRENPAVTYEITNTSNRILDGRVGWVDLAATETGYAEASPALRADLSAAPYLVVSPARLRLEPGKRAKVTIQLKRGVSSPLGERRSHLLIETTPVRTPLRRTGGGLEADVELGVSIPVLLRSGTAIPAVSFSQTRLVRDAEGLLEIETVLLRSGRYSAFGALTAAMEYGGERSVIAEIRNVALHVDAEKRRIAIPLGIDILPPGRLTLHYTGDAEFAGHAFATKTFEIAPPQ